MIRFKYNIRIRKSSDPLYPIDLGLLEEISNNAIDDPNLVKKILDRNFRALRYSVLKALYPDMSDMELHK